MRTLHIPNLIRLSWPEKRRYARTKGARAVAQLFRHLHVGRRSATGDPLGRTQDALERAFDAYRPRPYDGRVVLFRSAHQPWGIEADPRLGWHDLAPRMETCEVDSYFQCGVLDPAVKHLAAELSGRLASTSAPPHEPKVVERVR
jgi:hypothetical protein